MIYNVPTNSKRKLGWLFICRLKPWESISKPCFCVKNVFCFEINVCMGWVNG